MPRTLGLDIGSSSIGWALIDEGENRVLGIGVRVFPEGVERDKQGGEVSKNEQRRVARGMRRQIARRARRKAALRMALVSAGLYPADPESQEALDERDPYELRERALRERLEPFEIGRVLIHLNQRRGFLSNRKSDRGKKKDEASETLAKISELAARLEGRTLGQYLAAGLKDDRHRRIRGQHTRRDMLIDEFNRIWDAQREFHPQLLTDRLRHGARGLSTYPRKPEALGSRRDRTPLSEFGLHGLMFFQRSLYWPRSVIGRCELERKERRCERADRRPQRFRMRPEVNNLRITENSGLVRPLSAEERARVIELLSTKKEVKFDELRDKLKLPEGVGFNLERGERKKLDGLKTDAILAGKNYFGKAWAKLPEDRKNAIVRGIIDDEEERLLHKARVEWGCDEALARRLADLDLGQGYSALSLVAIEKLLPHLERGLKLMGNDPSDSALHAAGYLRPDERALRQCEFLPPPPDDINNPLVRQALFEVRKVVNAVIREWGRPDAIHIELAREVQGGANRREEISRRNRQREALRAQAAEEIRGWGSKPTRDAIERDLLWKEQDQRCLYSGKAISPNQLLGGEVDVDHLLPYSRSLDNSLANKVVCFRDENNRKLNRTVAEWLREADPAKYEAVLQRAARLPADVRDGKRRKIAADSVVLDDFLNRQLSDTAYITRKVHEFVRRLGVDVVCVKGQCTAELRHVWGLDSVLRSDDLKLKNREDHRHHAVDALVIALTDRSRLQQLARLRFLKAENPGFAPRPGTVERIFPRPWESFDADIQSAVDAILVSHRPLRRLSGALHEETLYGATFKPERDDGKPRPHARGWIEDESIFVVRKPLESLSPAEVGKIRDPQVRQLVIDRLKAHGIDPDARGARIPGSVWKEPLRMVGKGGTTGSPNAPVIRKVRITKDDQTIRPIRQGDRAAFVKPGNTHHIALFELPGSTPVKPRRVMKAVTMLEAAERARKGEPLVQRVHPDHPEARFLFSLSYGETVWGKFKGKTGLYCFVTSAATSGQMWFVAHTDARPDAKREKPSAMPNTLAAEKVFIDPLGRLRRAHD